MHAAVVTNVGLVVDAVIVERCADESELVYDQAGGENPLLCGDTRGKPSFLFCSISGLLTTHHAPAPASSSVTSLSVPPSSSVSCNIIESIMEDSVHYECRATKRPLPERFFHLFDVLPFGLESPSSVFGVVGRHTNRGLVLGITPEGHFLVQPYCEGKPLQLVPYGVNKKSVRKEDVQAFSDLSSSSSVLKDIAAFVEFASKWAIKAKKSTAVNAEAPVFRQGYEDLNESTTSESSMEMLKGMNIFSLKDLQLPPQLALHEAVPPLRVGSRVLARRYACGRSLHLARVCAVRYDVTYTLCYESDNGIDERVLHNDVHLLDDSNAEQCTVRDRVIVAFHKQLPGVIIECFGDERYNIILNQNPGQALGITRQHIVLIAPLLKEALYADPIILRWFRTLDPTGSGAVSWKDVRHLILGWESYGQSVSFQKLGEVQRDLCIRMGRLEPQLLRKVPLQEEEMLLGYPEFEYAIQRVRNLL